MHGIIFLQLYHYFLKITREQGNTIRWINLLNKAGIEHYTYSPTNVYPDEEMVKLLQTLSTELKIPLPQIIENFGESIAEYLITSYQFLIKPEWKSLDLIENAEAVIHSYLRTENTNLTPPYLQCRRIKENIVELKYNSQRKLCYFAKGLIRGIAKKFEENLKIQESLCMHKGSDHCLITVTNIT